MKKGENLLSIAPKACLKQECNECVTAWITKLLDINQNVRPVNTFHVEVQGDKRANGLIFECLEGSLPCACTNNNCSSAKAFCDIQKCSTSAACICHVKNAKTNLIRHDETGQAISNFKIISVKECYFNITKHTFEVHGSRNTSHKLLLTLSKERIS